MTDPRRIEFTGPPPEQARALAETAAHAAAAQVGAALEAFTQMRALLCSWSARAVSRSNSASVSQGSGEGQRCR